MKYDPTTSREAGVDVGVRIRTQSPRPFPGVSWLVPDVGRYLGSWVLNLRRAGAVTPEGGVRPRGLTAAYLPRPRHLKGQEHE